MSDAARASLSGFAWLFVFILLIIDSALGLMIYQQLRIARFPTTAGVVETTILEEHAGGASSAFMRCPRITFRYTVEGESYTGDRLRYGGYCSADLPHVDRVLRDLHDGGELRVRYNPARPSEAYLTMGLGPPPGTRPSSSATGWHTTWGTPDSDARPVGRP